MSLYDVVQLLWYFKEVSWLTSRDMTTYPCYLGALNT